MRRRNFLSALTALPLMPHVIDSSVRVTRIHDSIILDIETLPPGLSPLQIGTFIHAQIDRQLRGLSPTGRMPTKPPLQRFPPRTEMGRRLYAKKT